MKGNIEHVTEALGKMDKKEFLNAVPEFERKYHVTIVYEGTKEDINDFNEALREKLYRKQVTLNKFWVTPETLKKVENGQKVNKLYDQGKLKSSFLTSYINKDHMFVLVGLSIAHFNDAAKVINTLYIYVLAIAVVIILLLVWLLTKKMTDPLKKLKEVSEEISRLKFKKVNVRTNDEIEELAESINIMSDKLKQAHEDLLTKNENLKTFMADINHELKTPLSVIQIYAQGLKDGLDDGTYIDTILKQTSNISLLIEDLLNYSRIEKAVFTYERFQLLELFRECLSKYDLECKKKQIHVTVSNKVKGEVWVEADKNKFEMVFNNLISNAIKYTQNQKIDISFSESDDKVLFTIQNGADIDGQKIEKIWEPFYVIEASRNKNISGTGLGLAIVKSILERHHLKFGVKHSEGNILFYIYFNRVP